MVALNSRVFFDVVKEHGEFLLLGHEINNNLQQKVKTRLSLLTAKSEIKNEMQLVSNLTVTSE